MSMTTGRVWISETKNFIIINEEDYFITGYYVKVTIKDKNAGYFEKSTKFKHRIKIPFIFFNLKKEDALWDRARKEIENITKNKLYELEMEYLAKEKLANISK